LTALPRKVTKSAQPDKIAAWKLSVDAQVDANNEDLIDENDLLDESDFSKPSLELRSSTLILRCMITRLAVEFVLLCLFYFLYQLDGCIRTQQLRNQEKGL
jgi:uncharacterized membrane protein YciS (DUF1049 family)